MRLNRKAISLLTFVTVVLLLLSFTAQTGLCKKDIKVAYWDQGENNRLGFNAVIDAFNKSQNEINAIPDPIPGAIGAVILARIAGGTAPDVLWWTANALPEYVEANAVLDITPYIKRDKYDFSDFFENAVSGFILDGKTYGIPIALNVQVVSYNQDMLDAAGVAYPAENWTWNDMLNMAKKLTIRDGSGKAKQFGFTGFFGFFADGSTFMPVVWSNGGEVFNKIDFPTESLVTSKEVVDALTFIRDFRFKHKAEALPGEQTRISGEDHFVNGESAMAFTGPGVGNGIKKAGSKFRWNVQTFPRGTKGQPSQAGAVGLVILRDTKNPDAAWEFVKFMTSHEGFMIFDRAAGSGAIFPPRISAVKDILQNNPNKELNIAAMLKTMVNARTFTYRTKRNVDWAGPLTEAIRKIYTGSMDVMPAMRQVKPVLDTLMRKANQ